LQFAKHKKSLSKDKRSSIIQHLKQERALREELGVIVEYDRLDEIPLEDRRKAAEKPLYLLRYE
jgi:hypothetical protein